MLLLSCSQLSRLKMSSGESDAVVRSPIKIIHSPMTSSPSLKHEPPMSPENLSRRPMESQIKQVKVKNSLFCPQDGKATDLSQNANKSSDSLRSPTSKIIRQYPPESTQYDRVSPPVNSTPTVLYTMPSIKNSPSSIGVSSVVATPTTVVSRPYVISHITETLDNRTQVSNHNPQDDNQLKHQQKSQILTTASHATYDSTDACSSPPLPAGANITSSGVPTALEVAAAPDAATAPVTVTISSSRPIRQDTSLTMAPNYSHLTYSFVPGDASATVDGQPFVMATNDMTEIVMINPGEYEEVGPWQTAGDQRDHSILNGDR